MDKQPNEGGQQTADLYQTRLKLLVQEKTMANVLQVGKVASATGATMAGAHDVSRNIGAEFGVCRCHTLGGDPIQAG